MLSAIYHQANSIQAINREWAKDETSRNHLAIAAAIVGAVKVVGSELGDQAAAKAMVEKSIFRGTKCLLHDTLSASYALSLDAEDVPSGHYPLTVLAQSTQELIRQRYGTGFAADCRLDDASFLSVTITKCFYLDFFTSQGLPEVASSFCSRNLKLAEEHRSKNGVSVEIKSLMGCGAPLCRLNVTVDKASAN